MKRGRGRPAGGTNRCSFCGELGHVARDGSCSAASLALGMLEADRTQVDVARELGVTPSAISLALKRSRARGERPAPVRRAARADLALAYQKLQGATLDEAGARFGVSRQAVHQALRRAQWIAEVSR